MGGLAIKTWVTAQATIFGVAECYVTVCDEITIRKKEKDGLDDLMARLSMFVTKVKKANEKIDT